MAFDTTGTEAGRGKDEDLLGDGVDLPHALVVVDDGDPGLAYPQWNGSSWNDNCQTE